MIIKMMVGQMAVFCNRGLELSLKCVLIDPAGVRNIFRV